MTNRLNQYVVWGTIAALVLGAGCSAEETKSAGGLLLSTTTDLEVPKDVTHIGLQVITNSDDIRHQDWYAVGGKANQNKLPATLAIEAGKTDDPVTIRLFARKGEQVIALSEVTTTVPRDRVALLRMPVEWLSVGMVQPTNETAGSSDPASAAGGSDSGDFALPATQLFKTVKSSCPARQSPKAGSCTPSTIDSSTLPTYSAGQVFGTGTGNDGDGSCFDVGRCFESFGIVTIIDRNACLGLPSRSIDDPKKFALGLVTADGSGICGPSGCIVPLDFATTTTDSGFTVSTNGIKLPQSVCRKLDSGTVRAVVSTAACATKTAAIPTCGPWSRVSTNTAIPEGNAELLSLCWEFAETACAGIARCRGGRDFFPGAVQNDGNCTERMRFLCDASLATATAASYRTYFEDCTTAFAEDSCAELENKVRQACVEPEGIGTPKAAGTTCGFGECATGLTCLGAIPNGVGKCIQRIDADVYGPCGYGNALDAVLPKGGCADGLLCDPITQICRNPGSTNEACSTNLTCATGLVCVAGSCIKAVSEGSTCSDDSECAAGLHCILTGSTAKCRGPGSKGESCSVVSQDPTTVIGQENLCDLTAGLRCNQASLTCRAATLLETGKACTPSSTCAGGYCSGSLGTDASAWKCTSFAADGATCKAQTECAPPADCIAERCRLRPTFGVSAVTMQPIAGTADSATDGASTGAGFFVIKPTETDDFSFQFFSSVNDTNDAAVEIQKAVVVQ